MDRTRFKFVYEEGQFRRQCSNTIETTWCWISFLSCENFGLQFWIQCAIALTVPDCSWNWSAQKYSSFSDLEFSGLDQDSELAISFHVFNFKEMLLLCTVAHHPELKLQADWVMSALKEPHGVWNMQWLTDSIGKLGHQLNTVCVRYYQINTSYCEVFENVLQVWSVFFFKYLVYILNTVLQNICNMLY